MAEQWQSNGSAANWAPEVEFSPFRALSRRQRPARPPVTIPETLAGRGSTPVPFSFLNRRMGRDARPKTGIKVFLPMRRPMQASLNR